MTTIKTEIAGLEEQMEEISLQILNKNVKKRKTEKNMKGLKDRARKPENNRCSRLVEKGKSQCKQIIK